MPPKKKPTFNVVKKLPAKKAAKPKKEKLIYPTQVHNIRGEQYAVHKGKIYKYDKYSGEHGGQINIAAPDIKDKSVIDTIKNLSKAPAKKAPPKKKPTFNVIKKTPGFSPLSLKERIKLANTTTGNGYMNGYVGLIRNNKLISYANKEGKLSIFYDYTNGYTNSVVNNLSPSRKKK
tara:strand:- start:1459 stop:1986 length:528 start_codon:yes stop_codon:yes gene_type:complete